MIFNHGILHVFLITCSPTPTPQTSCRAPREQLQNPEEVVEKSLHSMLALHRGSIEKRGLIEGIKDATFQWL